MLSSRNSARNTRSPPPAKANSAFSSPSLKPIYPSLTGRSSNAWAAEEDEEEEEGDEEDDLEDTQQYMYSADMDEDEFGLPSISSMRRDAKRIPLSKTHDPGGGRDKNTKNMSLLNAGLSQSRERANSSDIAEERGPPDYPTAKKGEGKILRPQYKDILRGLFSFV